MRNVPFYLHNSSTFLTNEQQKMNSEEISKIVDKRIKEGSIGVHRVERDGCGCVCAIILSIDEKPY